MCSFQGGGHLFHEVVLASAPPSTNFKSIYSNQFKRYEYIQGIWEMQNFMKNTMVKKFLARAHFRARARRIFCLLGQILMIFEFSKRNEIWRAPRAQVRARQNFFYECIVCQKISLQFFWFVHSSKSEVFRAIWNLIIFLKIQLFSKNFSKFEKSNTFRKKLFSMKIHTFQMKVVIPRTHTRRKKMVFSTPRSEY